MPAHRTTACPRRLWPWPARLLVSLAGGLISCLPGCGTEELAASAAVSLVAYDDEAPGRGGGSRQKLPPVATSTLRPLIGGTDDVSSRYPAVGGLVRLDEADNLAGSCTATLIASDAVLTAAHCLPEEGLHAASGQWQASALRGRLLWVPAARPLPLALQPTYEVTAAKTLPGYHAGLDERLSAPPLWQRQPRSIEEAHVLAAFIDACGPQVSLFDQQAQLRCLTQLPADFQRALGVADAYHDVADLAVAFLDRPVQKIAPLAVARALATPILPPDRQLYAWAEPGLHAFLELVGYGLREAEVDWADWAAWPSWSAWFTTFQPRRVATTAALWAAGAHQLQLVETAPICFGDSGGPVLQRNRYGAAEVLAVASHAAPNLDVACKRFSLYTRADVVWDWIAATLRARKA